MIKHLYLVLNVIEERIEEKIKEEKMIYFIFS